MERRDLEELLETTDTVVMPQEYWGDEPGDGEDTERSDDDAA